MPVAEHRADVALDLRRRRRRQCEARRVAERPPHVAEAQVVGAEVVAPLAQAVRLVDGEAAHADLLHGGQEAVDPEALGGHVQEPNLAGAHPREPALPFVAFEQAVDAGRRQPTLAQRRHLVVHQRDQRRDDDGKAVVDEGRQLVAQRLAVAGGHQHQC